MACSKHWFSHTLCHHSSTASFFQSSSASETLAEHIPGRHLHVKTAKHKKLSSSYAPLRLHWISFTKVNSGWFTAITGVWEGLPCMTAALFTLMKCVRAGGGGEGGGLPPKSFWPFRPQFAFGPKIRGSPSPESATGKHFFSCFLVFSSQSLFVEKKISTVRHRTHLWLVSVVAPSSILKAVVQFFFTYNFFAWS